MKFLIYATVTLMCSVLLAISTDTQSRAQTPTRDCKPIEVLFARGSGQTTNQADAEAQRFINQLRDRIGDSDRVLDYYELGREMIDGYRYPAVKVSDWSALNGLGAKLSAGHHFAYGRSVKQGVRELQSYLISRTKLCTSTKWILGGYSQGAQVIGQTLGTLPIDMRNSIMYVALFGDPKLHLPEGEGFRPLACRGKHYYSPWRKDIESCKLSSGSLDARRPYLPYDMQYKTGLWCYKDDFVCGTSSNPLNIKGHGEYRQEGKAIDRAAAEAAERLTKLSINSPINIKKPKPPYQPPEIVYIFDTTRAMDVHAHSTGDFLVDEARAAIIRGGRVAVVAYRDADLDYSAKTLTNFTNDISIFEEAVSRLSVSHTWSDRKEGTLHALNKAFSELTWSGPKESKKSAIIISKHGFHEPDRTDQSTQATILNESFRLGGVKITAFVYEDVMPQYTPFTEITDGERYFLPVGESSYGTRPEDLPPGEPINDTPLFPFSINKFHAHTTATDEPEAVIANEDYIARPGESIVFDASSSYVDENATIDTYEWDFDADGTIDTSTTEPIIEHTYTAPFEGMIRLRIHDNTGQRAQTFAKVQITNEAARPLASAPADFTYHILETASSMSTIELTWDTTDSNTDRWILALNDNAMGYLESNRRSIVVTDVERDYASSFRIAAQNADGVQSDYREVIIPSLTGDTTVPDIPIVDPEAPTPEDPEQPTPEQPEEPEQPAPNPCDKHKNYFVRAACELTERIKAQARALLGQFYLIIGIR